MAKPSEKAIDYKARAQELSWAKLRKLWGQIKTGLTPGWDGG